MKLHTTYLEGAVLPTVVVAALVMLTATLGLLALWEQETLLFTRTQRLRQHRGLSRCRLHWLAPPSNRPPCSTACIPTNGL